MKRRVFLRGAIAAAVSLALPALPETWNYNWEKNWWRSSHARIVTDIQLVEANRYWGHKPNLIIVDEVVHKLLREVWDECT